MAIKSPTQPQQYEHLANTSAIQTKEHLQELVEVSKKISNVPYQATVTVYFYPLSVPGYSEGFTATLNFASGDKLEFDGKLLGASIPFSGECMGNATFFVSPDDLVQMGNVVVSTSVSVAMTSISWLPVGSFMGTPIPVPMPLALWGNGTFKKIQ